MSARRGKLNRRDFLRLSTIATTGVVIAGCTAPSAPSGTSAPAATAPLVPTTTTPAAGPAPAAKLSGKFTWGTQGLWDAKQESQWETARLGNQLMKKWLTLHPDAQIEQVPIPSALDQWIRLQITGGTAPDVTFMWRYPDIFRPDWWLDFNAELDKKNPYSTNGTWRADFRQDMLEFGLADTGEQLLVPVTLKGAFGQIAWLYNEDLFKKAGADIPDTWVQLLDASKKLKDAGITPFFQPAAGDSSYQLDWIFSLIFSSLAENTVLPKVYEQIDNTDKWKPGTPISPKQIAHAVKTGALSMKGNEVSETLRLLKQWSTYWQTGFLAPPASTAGDPWAKGEVAMRWAGMWDIKPLLLEIKPQFGWGTMLMPRITKDSSSLGTGQTMRHLGGSTGGSARADLPFMVPKTTASKPSLPLVLDFIKYVTAPEQLDWFNKNYDPPGFEPGTPIEQVFPDVQKRKGYQAFYTDVENRYGVQPMSSLSGGASNAQISILQTFLGDKSDLASTMEELDKAMQDEVDKVIAENPTWQGQTWK